MHWPEPNEWSNPSSPALLYWHQPHSWGESCVFKFTLPLGECTSTHSTRAFSDDSTTLSPDHISTESRGEISRDLVIAWVWQLQQVHLLSLRSHAPWSHLWVDIYKHGEDFVVPSPNVVWLPATVVLLTGTVVQQHATVLLLSVIVTRVTVTVVVRWSQSSQIVVGELSEGR